MRDIDERAAATEAVVERTVMAKVRRDVRIGDRGSLGQVGVPRAPADRDRAEHTEGVTRDTNALLCCRKRARNTLCKVLEGHGRIKLPHAPNPQTRICGIGNQRPRTRHPERFCKRIGDTLPRRVGIRVRGVQANVLRYQRVHDQPAMSQWRHGVHSMQEERMVRDNEIRADADGFVDDGHDRVDSEEHGPNRGDGITAHQPDGIPVRCEPWRIPGIKRRHDVGQDVRACHVMQATLGSALCE
jgi:hypothetical protein